MNRSIDWLTASMSLPATASVMRMTVEEEPGQARPGFARSEKRMCLGGFCWRRWEPRQPSKRWDKAYESWEWAGPPAGIAARQLHGQEVKPSRIDIAYDFDVAEVMTPDVLIEQIRQHVTERRTSLGITGQDDQNTRYVGSKNSPRRIRIYRKDWQTPALRPLGFGPMLRIELILRDEHAEAFWDAWDMDEAKGFAIAAAHIAEMTGLRVQPEVGDVPELVLPEGMDEASELLQFLQQHGPRIDVWMRVGIPLLQLASMRAARMSRAGRFRAKSMEKRLSSVGIDQITSIVRSLLTCRDEPSIPSFPAL